MGVVDGSTNWNGGPRGYKNKRTEYYWAKVQLELKEIDI